MSATPAAPIVQVAGHRLTFEIAGNGYRYRSVDGTLSGYVAACYTVNNAAAVVRTRLQAFAMGVRS